MVITISPAKKTALMVGLGIMFFGVIHFVAVPCFDGITIAPLSTTLRVTLAVFFFLNTFAGITFVKMYRPLVPGQSTCKQDIFWKPLVIEKTMAGGAIFFCWVTKIFIFTVVLYAVLTHTIGLYQKNLPEIMSGTWEYDKMEAAFMGAPLVMIFLLVLFIGVKLYDYLVSGKDNKIK